MLGTPEVAALPAAYTGENTQHEKSPRATGLLPSPLLKSFPGCLVGCYRVPEVRGHELH